ncbi:MAG: TIGR01244 family sulfur transferase [Pseudomonadota bacterium]
MNRLPALFLSTLPVLAACNEVPDRAVAAPAADRDAAVPSPQSENPSMFRTLTPDMLVAPQISVADIATAKEQGVTLIVNNRPDGEAPDQPAGAEIQAAAEAAGIDYVAIPVGHSGFSAPQIEALNTALTRHEDGKTLAYCRSGTRSTFLWSLARAQQGVAPSELARLAGNAGYDISPLTPMLDALSGKASE